MRGAAVPDHFVTIHKPSAILIDIRISVW